MKLPLSQSWLPKHEPAFHPGTAHISWSNGQLHLQATIIDDEVNTTASANQQRLWEHGDVVEFFVQRVGEIGYHEYQIAPNGFILSLFYPDITCVAEVRRGKRRLEEFLTNEIPVAEVSINAEGWSVSLSIPLASSPGEKFRVSCCRYDYGTGHPPIISSTSPHPVRDFHRPQDWREIILMEE